MDETPPGPASFVPHIWHQELLRQLPSSWALLAGRRPSSPTRRERIRRKTRSARHAVGGWLYRVVTGEPVPESDW